MPHGAPVITMPKIFSVGDLNIDLFTHSGGGANFGEERHAEKFYYSLGGNAANFAVASSSLGLDTTIVSALGKDVFTTFLLSELKRFRVKPLLKKTSSPNGVSNIFVRNDGERAILSSKGCLLELDSKAVARFLLPRLSEDDIVFFGGFFHLPKMRNSFSALLKSIRKKKALVFFDACFDEYGKWLVSDFIRHVDAFFLNELELRHITKSRSQEFGIKKLFKMGANRVVLKRGNRGAEFYCKGAKHSSAALPVKPFNATGAGDFFNAGYAYGAVNGFGSRNRLICGNFVAGRKIAEKTYFAPTGKMLKNYLLGRNLAEIIKVRNYGESAKAAAAMVVRQLRKKPESVISLAAGKTPLAVYRALALAYKKREADFSKAAFVELDEYAGTTDERDSFAFSLKKNFLGKVNFRPQNVFLFNGNAKNLGAECGRIAAVVKARGLDLALLGIGANAHIAFNEPGTAFNSKTRVVKISKGVLRARKADFAGAEPAKAITLGISTIMSARKIILVASGRAKARAISKSFSRRPDEGVPASVLQRHGNAKILVDSAAGRNLL